MSSHPTPPSRSLRVNECHKLYIFSDSRFNVLNAGRGFGKTQSIFGRIVKHMSTPYTDWVGQPLPHKIWYIAPTLKQGKTIFWNRLKDFFTGFIKEKNECECRITLMNGTEIRIVGSEQYDNLRGPYLTLAIFDEFAFHKPDYWTRVIRPMLGRVKPLGGADFLSTPDGHNEFYELFQLGDDPKQKDWACYHYTTHDGGFIPDEEIEAAKATMSLAEWRQEYFGEFIASAGRVYHAYDSRKHAKGVRYIPGLAIHMAWDFNSYPACHMLLSHVEPLDNGKITNKSKMFIFDEIAIGHTDANMEEFMKRYPIDRIVDERGRVPAIHIYGDVSGQHGTTGVTDYQVVENALIINGYKQPVTHLTTKNPFVKDRTNSVNTKLQNAKGTIGLYLDRHNCPKLHKDFEMVKLNEQGKIDKITDPKITHASDAIGYQIWALWPVASLATRTRNSVKVGETMPGGYWIDTSDHEPQRRVS